LHDINHIASLLNTQRGLAEKSKKNHANLRKNFQFPNQDSNRAAPEKKSESLCLTLLLLRFVTIAELKSLGFCYNFR